MTVRLKIVHKGNTPDRGVSLLVEGRVGGEPSSPALHKKFHLQTAAVCLKHNISGELQLSQLKTELNVFRRWGLSEAHPMFYNGDYVETPANKSMYILHMHSISAREYRPPRPTIGRI